MNLGDSLDFLDVILNSILIICLIFLPLGIWKFIEILIWIFNLNWKALFN